MNEQIDYGEMLEHSGYHIRRAYSHFSRIYTHFGKLYGIKSQQATILTLAKNNPGISPAVIADTNEMERSLMTTLSADLERRGFIKSRPSKQDKRHKGFYITKAGENFLAEVMHTFLTEMEPKINRNLSAKEIKQLHKLLQKVYADKSD